MMAKQMLSECPLAPGIDVASPKARTYAVLFALKPGDRVARAVEVAIAGLILLNVGALVLESVEPIRSSIGKLLLAIEVTTVVAFTLEYVLRMWSVTVARDYQRPVVGRLRYSLTFFALVDLVSILPLYATMVGANLKVVSAARMLRLFKLGRYSTAMQSLVAVFVDKRREMFAAMLILVSLLLLASCGIYLVESEAQPEVFGSVPESLWWSVITITAVGYGDVTPVTPMGKAFTGVIALLGVLAVAIPTGIVSAGFFEEFRGRSLPARCPHCGKSMNSESGA